MGQLVNHKKASILNKRLTRLMNEKNFNLSTLSQKAGISIGTVQKMLNDPCCNPTISSLEAICNALDVSISYLIGYPEKPNNDIETNILFFNWETLKDDLLNFSKDVTSKNNFITDGRGANFFALKVIESSMMPIFPIGTTLIFDMNKPYYDGCYILVYLSQTKQYVFKRLLVDEPNLYIKSINLELKESGSSQIERNQIIATLIQAKM